MIITTAKFPDRKTVMTALRLAEQWNSDYVPRKKRSMKSWLKETQQPIYVVGKEQEWLYHPHSEHPFFFHPSMALLRIKSLQKGKDDPLINVSRLEEGMTFLDATLGLGADSIVASYITGGKGKVISLEANPYMARIVQQGLQNWSEPVPGMNEAMRRIKVHTARHERFLSELGSNSVDVVYFDPMFTETVESSIHLEPLKHLAIYEELKGNTIKQAERVAKKRVILKDHYRSLRFNTYGFSQIIRSTASFHYGIIEKEGR